MTTNGVTRDLAILAPAGLAATVAHRVPLRELRSAAKGFYHPARHYLGILVRRAHKQVIAAYYDGPVGDRSTFPHVGGVGRELSFDRATGDVRITYVRAGKKVVEVWKAKSYRDR